MFFKREAKGSLCYYLCGTGTISLSVLRVCNLGMCQGPSCLCSYVECIMGRGPTSQNKESLFPYPLLCYLLSIIVSVFNIDRYRQNTATGCVEMRTKLYLPPRALCRAWGQLLFSDTLHLWPETESRGGRAKSLLSLPMQKSVSILEPNCYP